MIREGPPIVPAANPKVCEAASQQLRHGIADPATRLGARLGSWPAVRRMTLVFPLKEPRSAVVVSVQKIGLGYGPIRVPAS